MMVALSDDPAAQNATEMWQAMVAPAAQQRAARDPRDVAYQVLRALATQYVPDAGPLQDAESIVRFGSKIRQSLDLLFGAFIPMRDGSRQIQLQADAAARGESDAWAATSAKSVRELARLALDWRDPSVETLRAIQNAFADFIISQVAIVDGFVRGVRKLLEDLSPAQVESRYAREGSSLRFGAFKEAAFYKMYATRYRELTDESGTALAQLLGEALVTALRAQPKT